jgi:chromosome segregation ATPase
MRLVALEVESFGCVEEASLQLGPGLNVLYGPNDLGKSTLAHAVRAALLLLPTSRDHADFQPWHKDATPRVRLRLQADDGRTYRLEKTFGAGTRGSASLEWSSDGRDFVPEAQGRAVEARLRELLGWGLPEVGGRGAGRGLPSSFLATALLGRQAQPGSIFTESLQTDGDDARARLTEALQAFAQDPMFKEILDRAQAEVDRAYTQQGKPSKSKDSPFRRIADRIQQLSTDLRTLEERVHDSDDVRTRIADLVAARDEAAARREEARTELARVQTDHERTRDRHAAAERLAAGEVALAQIRAKIEGLARLRDELHDHEADRPAAEAAHAKAALSLREADEAMREAKGEHERAIAGGDAEDRLARQSMLTRQAHAAAERQRMHELVQAIEEADRIAQRHAEAMARAVSISADLRTAEERHREAEHARRQAEGKRRIAEAALAVARLAEAEARRDEIRVASERAVNRRQAAAEARSEAEAIALRLSASALPDPATLRSLVELDARRRVAAASLGGGMSVAVALEGARAVRVTRDEAAAETAHEAAFTVDAERRIALALDGVGEIVVTAGDPRAREAAEVLERRFAAEVAPVLLRAGAADLEALARKVEEAEVLRQKVQAGRAHAEALEQQADEDDARAEGLPRAEALVRERALALGGLDRDAIAQAPEVAGLDEAALRRRATEAEGAIAEATAVAARIGRELATLAAQREQAETHATAVAAELEAAHRRLGGDPSERLAAAHDALAAAEGKLEAVEAEIERFDAAGEGRRAAAHERLERARDHLEQMTALAERSSSRLAALDQQIERCRGAIAVAEQAVAELDEPAARARVDDARAALEAIAPPIRAASEADVAAARTHVSAAEARLRDVEAELGKSEGALAQVGGEVAREKADDTRRALEDARRQEHEVELDYEGWRLLVQTLRETETTEGRHLGDALVEPIRQRFTDLTAGRYGELALGPDLDARGVRAAGNLRELTDFSEGVQEQLATLLRVTIAEQLGSMLVLDDHLTQTDPARIEWFRRLLRQAADRVQIVVLTCRPADYLADDELAPADAPVRDTGAGTLRAIDLSRLVRRASTT